MAPRLDIPRRTSLVLSAGPAPAAAAGQNLRRRPHRPGAVIRLSIRSVRRRFGAGADAVEALGPVGFEVGAGEFAAIIGPSGCGKSTLLKLIAGLDHPDHGRILLDDRPVTEPDPRCGMVFQQFALFPWLTIRRNVRFGIAGRRDAGPIADRLIDAVGLAGFADRYPDNLSGGMQQRAALARAFARQPQMLLLDEPFGSLDQQTRGIMQELLETLWGADRRTVLLVTHDIDEALYLADRVHVMSARPGRILASLPVGFERPRDPGLRNTPAFTTLKATISDLLRDEVAASLQMTGRPPPA